MGNPLPKHLILLLFNADMVMKEGRLRLLGKRRDGTSRWCKKICRLRLFQMVKKADYGYWEKKKKKKKKKKEGLSMRIHRSLTLEKVTFTSRGTKPLHRARYHPIAYRYSSRLQENLLVESS